MRLFSRSFALAGALLFAAVPAAVAEPTAAEQKAAAVVLRDYEDGQIDACKYTVAELQAALDGITANVRQYASDFPAAVRDAIATHARGGCDEAVATPTAAPTTTAVAPSTSGGGAAPPSTPASTVPETSGPRTIVPDPPAPAAVAVTPQPGGPDPAVERAAAASPGNGTPVPLIGLGVLSALALLSVMMLAALRRLGEGEGRLAPAYHSWREAQWRVGGVSEDFRDWLRLGH